MNNQMLINVIDDWLRMKFQIPNGKYKGYQLFNEQSFLNLFDFLFALFKEINLKYIIINSKDLPQDEFEHLPLPSLIINYDVVGERQVIGSIEMVENVDILRSIENCFIIIAEKSESISVSLIDVFLGTIYKWGKEILSGILLTVLLLGSFLDFFQLYEQIVFFLCLIGLFISQDLLEVQHDVQNKNSLVNKICGGGTAKSISDCKKISEHSSKVFNFLEWSEIGIFYFLGVLLNFVFIGLGEYSFLTYYFILITSAIGILFSFYSFHQQYKLKIFCKACSLIILIFYILFGISISEIFTFTTVIEFNLSLIFQTIIFSIIFLLSMTYVLLIKSRNSIKQKYSYTKKRLLNYTTDSEIFEKINTKKISDDDFIFLNNNSLLLQSSSNVDNILTVFVCTHCPHCSDTLRKIYKDLSGLNLEIRIVHKPVRMGFDSENDAVRHAGMMIAVFEKYGIETYLDLFEFNQKVKLDIKQVEQEINTNYPIESSLLNDSIIAAINILKITKAYNVERYPTLMLNNTFISRRYSLEELSLHF